MGQLRNTNLPSVTDPDGLREDTVYVSGLPQNIDHESLKKEFSVIGSIKMNQKTNMPMIWIFKEKGIPKGDGLVTFDDPNSVQAAIDHFQEKEFKTQKIVVKQATNNQRPIIIPPGGGNMVHQQQGGGGQEMMMRIDMCPMGGRGGGRGGGGGMIRPGYMGGRGMYMGGGGGSGGPPGGIDPKRCGDWNCPECGNVNFAWRSQCNRCERPHDPMMDNMMMGGGGSKPPGLNRGGYRGGGSMGNGNPLMGAPIRGGAGGSGFNGNGRGGMPQGGAGGMVMMPPNVTGMGRGGPLRGLGAAGPGCRLRPAPY